MLPQQTEIRGRSRLSLQAESRSSSLSLNTCCCFLTQSQLNAFTVHTFGAFVTVLVGLSLDYFVLREAEAETVCRVSSCCIVVFRERFISFKVPILIEV